MDEGLKQYLKSIIKQASSALEMFSEVEINNDDEEFQDNLDTFNSCMSDAEMELEEADSILDEINEV